MPPADPPPLTASAAKTTAALALYDTLMAIWDAGHRQALVTRNRDGSLSAGSVNARIDIPATVVYSKSA